MDAVLNSLICAANVLIILFSFPALTLSNCFSVYFLPNDKICQRLPNDFTKFHKNFITQKGTAL